jgi:hypothetical protein
MISSRPAINMFVTLAPACAGACEEIIARRKTLRIA